MTFVERIQMSQSILQKTDLAYYRVKQGTFKGKQWAVAKGTTVMISIIGRVYYIPKASRTVSVLEVCFSARGLDWQCIWTNS